MKSKTYKNLLKIEKAPSLTSISQNIVDSKPETPSDTGIEIPAPTPGNILQINVNLGEKVSKDQTLLVMEAMKMESEVKSPHSGIIKNIHVNSGDTVKLGDSLITLEN